MKNVVFIEMYRLHYKLFNKNQSIINKTLYLFIKTSYIYHQLIINVDNTTLVRRMITLDVFQDPLRDFFFTTNIVSPTLGLPFPTLAG